MTAPRQVLDRQYIYIIGAARSGTTWLHRMLGEHPQVASLPGNELTMFSRYLPVPIRSFKQERADHLAGRWTLGLGKLWDETRFTTWTKDFLASVYADVLATRPEATHILDKHPNYSQYVPLIDELMPGSRFIHLIRDGREVAVSALSVNKRLGHSAGEIAQAARDWNDFTLKARTSGAAMGERYLEIRYEDLKKGDLQLYRRIFDHCGLPATDAWLSDLIAANHISKKQFSTGDKRMNALRDKPGAIWMDGLSAMDRYRFHRWAGDLLMELGYAQRNWWSANPLERLAVRVRLFGWRILRTLQIAAKGWSNAAVDPLEPLTAWRRAR